MPVVLHHKTRACPRDVVIWNKYLQAGLLACRQLTLAGDSHRLSTTHQMKSPQTEDMGDVREGCISSVPAAHRSGTPEEMPEINVIQALQGPNIGASNSRVKMFSHSLKERKRATRSSNLQINHDLHRGRPCHSAIFIKLLMLNTVGLISSDLCVVPQRY